MRKKQWEIYEVLGHYHVVQQPLLWILDTWLSCSRWGMSFGKHGERRKFVTNMEGHVTHFTSWPNPVTPTISLDQSRSSLSCHIIKYGLFYPRIQDTAARKSRLMAVYGREITALTGDLYPFTGYGSHTTRLWPVRWRWPYYGPV